MPSSSQPYAPVGQGDGTSANTSPRLGENVAANTASPGSPRRSPSPGFLSPRMQSPLLGSAGTHANLFSSAHAYAPVAGRGDGGVSGSESAGGLGGRSATPMERSNTPNSFYGRPDYRQMSSSLGSHSRPLSMASSHLMGGGVASDYDSLYRLGQFDSGIPLNTYDKEAASGRDSPAEYYYGDAGPRDAGLARYGEAKEMGPDAKRVPHKKRWWILAGVVVLLTVLVVAIAVPLTTLLDNDNVSGAKDGATVPGTGPKGQVLTSGGDGSKIRMDNGTIFTYTNPFGGTWSSNLTDNSAQAQNYTPALNATWDYGKDKIFGVNLGGWLVIEPFIVPSFFEPYENTSSPILDEYGLSQLWASQGQLEKNMRQHYDTFITEYDFALIAGAGLNWVRLPLGYWAIETMENEPYLPKVSWEYFLKAIQWARKYGLRIELDLHAMPGNVNNYNHGGKTGVLNFLNSAAGMQAAQRGLNYIRVITEYISQPEVANVVPIFGIINEPNTGMGIGIENLKRFYAEAYRQVRNVTGTGAGNGPIMAISDGFAGLPAYDGFLSQSDRVAWDQHAYVAFTPPFPAQSGLTQTACNYYGNQTDSYFVQNGLVIAGEWSLATNDCGLYLNGVGLGFRYENSDQADRSHPQYYGSCVPFDNWPSYSNSTKAAMKQSALAQMDALRNFFFWTWKIGDSLRTGQPVNPSWSYLLGLQQGWMPTSPHQDSKNFCASYQKQNSSASITWTGFTSWSSTFSDWMTGAASTYNPQTQTFAWPPTSLSTGLSTNSNIGSTAVSAIPTYTLTGSPLSAATPTISATVQGEATPTLNPWADSSKFGPAYAAVNGCGYYNDIFNIQSSDNVGSWPCTGSAAPAQAKRSPKPLPTPVASPNPGPAAPASTPAPRQR